MWASSTASRAQHVPAMFSHVAVAVGVLLVTRLWAALRRSGSRWRAIRVPSVARIGADAQPCSNLFCQEPAVHDESEGRHDSLLKVLAFALWRYAFGGRCSGKECASSPHAPLPDYSRGELAENLFMALEELRALKACSALGAALAHNHSRDCQQAEPVCAVTFESRQPHESDCTTAAADAVVSGAAGPQTAADAGKAEWLEPSGHCTLERTSCVPATLEECSSSERHAERAAACLPEEVWEQALMVTEDLLSWRREAALERNRTAGVMEELRRMADLGLRAKKSADRDAARIATLEEAQCEERRKSVEQAVAFSRCERRLRQLEEQLSRQEQAREQAGERAREAERQSAGLKAELQQLQAQLQRAVKRADEEQERATRAGEELERVRGEAQRQVAEMSGALEEMRSMMAMRRASAHAMTSPRQGLPS